MKQLLKLFLVIASFFLSSADEDGHPNVASASISQLRDTLMKQIKNHPFTDTLAEQGTEFTEGGSTDFNAETDLILEIIKYQILSNGWDPAKLYDYDIAFDYEFSSRNYSGSLSLTGGLIRELSTATRNDNVFITYDIPPTYMKLSIPIYFESILVDYDFKMNVESQTVQGRVFAWINDITSNYDIEISLATMHPVSESFAPNINYVDIDICTSDIISPHRKLLVQLTEDFMRSTATQQTEAIFGKLLTENVLLVI